MPVPTSTLAASPRLTVRSLPGRWQALGAALHFVSRHEPFSRFPAGALVRTVSGQIDRGHYRFALIGERVVGYIGWAMYDSDVAERFAANGQAPDESLARGADVVWILTAVVSGEQALLPMYRAVAALHPGLRLMGVRHKGPTGGTRRRVVFDRRLPGLEPFKS